MSIMDIKNVSKIRINNKQNIPLASQVMPDYKQKINDFVSNLDNSKNDYEMIKTIINYSKENNIKKLQNGVYNIGNYYILSGYKNKNYDVFYSNIKFLNENNFCTTSAPKIENYISSKDNQYCALILKVADSNTELRKYNPELVNDDSKRVFVQEMLDLLNKKNVYNPYVVETHDNWNVTDSGAIFIDRWGDFKTCQSDNEKDMVKEKLLSMCGIVYS